MIDEEIVHPVSNVIESGIGIAILVNKAAVLDLEAEVIHAISHGIDQVLTKILGVCSIVLDKVEAGLSPAFVISMQLDELCKSSSVTSNICVHGSEIGRGDFVVGGCAGCRNRIDDQVIDAVGGICTRRDVSIRNAAVKALVGHDQIGHTVEAGARCRVIGIELRQPFRHLLQGGIGVAILVQKIVALNLEAQVIDAVGHGIDQVLTTILSGRTVVLNIVEPGFLPTFIIAMQGRPLGQVVGANVLVHRHHFRDGELAVGSCAGSVGRLHDELVEAVGGRRPLRDVAAISGARQSVVCKDEIDELVEPRSGRSGHGFGQGIGFDLTACSDIRHGVSSTDLTIG